MEPKDNCQHEQDSSDVHGLLRTENSENNESLTGAVTPQEASGSKEPVKRVSYTESFTSGLWCMGKSLVGKKSRTPSVVSQPLAGTAEQASRPPAVSQSSNMSKEQTPEERVQHSPVHLDSDKLPMLPQKPAALSRTMESEKPLIQSVVKAAAVSVTSLLSRVRCSSLSGVHNSVSSLEFSNSDECSRYGEEADDETEDNINPHIANRRKVVSKHWTPRSLEPYSSDEDDTQQSVFQRQLPRKHPPERYKQNVFAGANQMVNDALSSRNSFSFYVDSEQTPLFKGESSLKTPDSGTQTPSLEPLVGGDESAIRRRFLAENFRQVDSSENAKDQHQVLDHLLNHQRHTPNAFKGSHESGMQQPFQRLTGNAESPRDERCSKEKAKQSFREQSRRCSALACERYNGSLEKTRRDHVQSEALAMSDQYIIDLVKSYHFSKDTCQQILDEFSSVNAVAVNGSGTCETDAPTTESECSGTVKEFSLCGVNPVEKDMEENERTVLFEPNGSMRDHNVTDNEQSPDSLDGIINVDNLETTVSLGACDGTDRPVAGPSNRVQFNREDTIHPTSRSSPASLHRKSTLPRKSSTRVKSIMKKSGILKTDTNTEELKKEQQTKHSLNSLCQLDCRYKNLDAFYSGSFKCLALRHCSECRNTQQLCPLHRELAGVRMPKKFEVGELSDHEMAWFCRIHFGKSDGHFLNRMRLVQHENRTKWNPTSMFRRVTGFRPLLKPLMCSTSLKDREGSNKNQGTCTKCDDSSQESHVLPPETDKAEYELDLLDVLPPFYFMNLRRCKIGSLAQNMSKYKPASSLSVTVSPSKPAFFTYAREKTMDPSESYQQNTTCEASQHHRSGEVTHCHVSAAEGAGMQADDYKEKGRGLAEGKPSFSGKSWADIDICQGGLSGGTEKEQFTKTCRDGDTSPTVLKADGHQSSLHREPTGEEMGEKSCRQSPPVSLQHRDPGSGISVSSTSSITTGGTSLRTEPELDTVNTENEEQGTCAHSYDTDFTPNEQQSDERLSERTLPDNKDTRAGSSCSEKGKEKSAVSVSRTLTAPASDEPANSVQQPHTFPIESDEFLSALIAKLEMSVQAESQVSKGDPSRAREGKDDAFSALSVQDHTSDGACRSAESADTVSEMIEKETSMIGKTISMIEKETPMIGKKISMIEKETPMIGKTISMIEKETPMIGKKMSMIEKKTSMTEKKMSMIEKETLIVKKMSMIEKVTSMTEKKMSMIEKETSMTEKKMSMIDKETPMIRKRTSMIVKKMSMIEKETPMIRKKSSMIGRKISKIDKKNSMMGKKKSKIEMERSLSPEHSLACELAKDSQLQLTYKNEMKQMIMEQIVQKMKDVEPQYSSLVTNRDQRQHNCQDIEACTLPCCHATTPRGASRGVDFRAHMTFFPGTGQKPTNIREMTNQEFYAFLCFLGAPPEVIQCWQQSTLPVRKFVQKDPRDILSTSNIHGKMTMQKAFIQKVPACMLEKGGNPPQIPFKTDSDLTRSFSGAARFVPGSGARRLSGGGKTSSVLLAGEKSWSTGCCAIEGADKTRDGREEPLDSLDYCSRLKEAGSSSSSNWGKAKCSAPVGNRIVDGDDDDNNDDDDDDGDDLFAEFEEFPDFSAFFREWGKSSRGRRH